MVVGDLFLDFVVEVVDVVIDELFDEGLFFDGFVSGEVFLLLLLCLFDGNVEMVNVFVDFVVFIGDECYCEVV